MFSRIVQLRGVCVALIALWVVSAATGVLAAQEQSAPASPAPGTAGQATTTIDAGSVSVKADALAPTNAAPASDIVVIDADQIKATKARDLADLLKLAAGVNISDYGNAGGAQSVSIRGSTSQQVLVIVDGQRMNSLEYGDANLQLLNSDNIEKIEILRGGASAAYGADALGGVIRVTTKKATKDYLTVSVENQSYIPQAYTSSAGANMPPNPLALLDGQHYTFDGSFAIEQIRLSVLGTYGYDQGLFTYQESPGVIGQREQISTYGGNGQIGITAPLADGELNATITGVAKRTGAPYTTTSPEPYDYEDDDGIGATLGWKTDRFLTDALNFESQIWTKWTQLKFIDPAYGDNTNSNVYSSGIDLNQSAFLGDSLDLNYGVSGRYDTVQSANTLLSDGSHPYRVTGSAFVNPVFRFGSLTLSPAIRIDGYSDVPLGIGLDLGSELAIDKDISLVMSLSRSYHAPTFDQLYYADSFTRPNPHLTPETGYSGDFGLQLTNSEVNSRSVIFGRYVLDQIEYIDSVTPATYANVSKSAYFGFDQDLNFKVEWVSFGLNYEYNSSYYLGDSASLANNLRVDYVPEHLLRSHMGIKVGQFDLTLSQEFQSLRYTDVPNTDAKSLPAFFVLSAQVVYNLSKDSSIWLAADNLLNTQYQLTAGFPMPGLGLRLGLKLSI